MDYYDILLAKKLNDGGGGGNEFKTGSFTPNSDTQSVTIETGLASITGMVVHQMATTNAGTTMYYNNTMTIFPNSTYAKFFGAWASNNGSNKSWTQYVSDTPPYTVTGGSIQISVPSKYFKANVEYKWEAW